MPLTKLPTEFAPAERASADKTQQQCRYFSDLPMLRLLLDSVPSNIFILNPERQAVFANQTVLDFLGGAQGQSLCGLRTGEAFGCIHSCKTEGGCGTTKFCSTCGAAKAILASQKGVQSIQECRMMRGQDQEPLDLRVWATPFTMGSEQFTFFAAADISHEKRRRALERIFFHDILNTAVGLRGFVQLLGETDTDLSMVEEFRNMTHGLSERLIEEINAQRELNAAENNELSVHPETINSLKLLKQIADMYRGHEVAKQRHIRIDSGAQEATFTSDPVLLRRVIGNMLKNALEATQPDETVTLGCELMDKGIQFWVHNPNFMPSEVQLQVFQRSFSTKGAGRGLGTYSIKLLTERYLKGKVSFTTSPETGTTFQAWYPMALEEKLT
jgi:signal transduction histidine kinase